MHLVLPAGTLKWGPMKVSFAFPDLPVSLACLASCELHQLSRVFPRELPWSQQQQNTQYFSAVPCDWEGERGRSHGWDAFLGTLPSPLWHKCQFKQIFACWKSGLWLYRLPKCFTKWVIFLISWLRWKFLSPAVFIVSRMQCTRSSAAQRTLPQQCFMHADALHKAETSNLNSTINFTET